MVFRFALAFVLVMAVPLPAHAQLPVAVVEKLRAAQIPEDAMGALVMRLSDGAIVLAHEAERPRQPASTMKVVTAIVALDKLGPAWRGTTELLMAGTPVDGVLRGDIILRGRANVDFGWRELERLLQLLRYRGVKEIRGDLILDLTYFQPARTDVGLPPFDEAPEFRYNYIPDALMLNANLLQLDIVSEGDELRVYTTPQVDGVSVTTDMKLIERRCLDWEDGWILPTVTRHALGEIRIHLHGDFPRSCQATTAINVIERTAYSERLFRSLWRRLGGTFRGKVREGAAPAAATRVGQHRSRPLAEVTRDVLKDSDNPITRVLFLAVGANAVPPNGEPTARRADAEVRAWLERQGVDARGIVLENGSGLSRHERISPMQLGLILKAAAGMDWAIEFLASLPIVSVDGTMRRRLKGTAADSRGRIKTGTLRDATAVAGFVKDQAGETYIVVGMLDHERATNRSARPVVDALIEWAAGSIPAIPLAQY